jgi:futalosine hydrolase
MKILLVSATTFEIQPVLDKFPEIHYLITGVGVPGTIYRLIKQTSIYEYDLIIHAGIAGTFNREISLGSVFQVNKDRFGDLGAELDETNFADVFDLGLCSPNEFPFENGWLINPVSGYEFLPFASGITVNKVTGVDRIPIYDADLETMESAALFYVCLMENLNFLSIRSVSNYVEKRDKSKWEIKKAITNLNEVLFKIYDLIK